MPTRVETTDVRGAYPNNYYAAALRVTHISGTARLATSHTSSYAIVNSIGCDEHIITAHKIPPT